MSDRVIRGLVGRGFVIDSVENHLIRARLGKLLIEVFLVPGIEFPIWFNPLDMINELKLDDVRALIVVSERPYTITDHILDNINKARYWFNRNINLKVYAVNSEKLEEDLEDAVNLIVTNFHDDVSNTDSLGSKCPSCGNPMRVRYTFRYNSVRWRSWVNETVEVCDRCNVIIHRLQLG
ncbi:hypothetical protein [Vulcanisaeta thermophila]|uniref:hypothetical protein n=1 Tax=Vulcanisaeta thermophila TaxID=867917 RepID=UPI00085364A5|nr:hypothetical protein [Vulcanisaeta thermophila]